MRPSVLSWLIVGLILASCLGCSSPSGRTYHGDPFASQPARRWNDVLIDTQPPAASTSQDDFRPARPKRQVASTRDKFLLVPGSEEEDPPDQADRVVPASFHKAATTQEPVSAHEPVREPQPKLGGGMDHAPDYSWIQGQLEHSALGGGVWKVRYAPISEDDEHGGSVILESDPSKKGLQPGDMVYVEGQLLPSDSRGVLRNPLYRAKRVKRIEE